jgi:8-oxo-dGTP diphosphatase
MSATKSRRRGAASIDLVLCAAHGGALHVLVVKSASGAPVLPYTWMVDGEDPEDGARELARTLTGHAVAWIAPGRPTATKRHPSGAALSVPFVAVVGPAVVATGGASWHPMQQLPALAPRQMIMAGSALEILQLHMDAAPVALRLLPSVLTLSELQQAYELLLGRRLHKASFRRALQAAYLAEPTDEWRSEGRGRPAQLFRFAPRKRRRGHRSVRFDLMGT